MRTFERRSCCTLAGNGVADGGNKNLADRDRPPPRRLCPAGRSTPGAKPTVRAAAVRVNRHWSSSHGFNDPERWRIGAPRRRWPCHARCGRRPARSPGRSARPGADRGSRSGTRCATRACIRRISAKTSSDDARVEVAGGLVGQHQRRLQHQRARDGHALLHAAGEFAPAACPSRLPGPPRPAARARASRCAGVTRPSRHQRRHASRSPAR